MTMSASDHSVLITGASSGIGQAVAVELARHGSRVVVTSRDPGRLEETLDLVRGVGGVGEGIRLDPLDAAGTARALDEAWNEHGPIDALVNNAAELLRRAALDVTQEEWSRVMDTNLRSPFFLSQAFARRCIDADRPGAIVNVSSTHGRAVLVDRSTYGIAKAALDHMTRSLAVEWARHRIRVNAIVPATVSTPSREAAFADPEVRKRMTDRIPAGRFATAEEVAVATRFLLSPDTGFITGECLVMDGGLTLV
jgi:2-dehydro-3-deoxy-D-gluconate 5-dehydrogenase